MVKNWLRSPEIPWIYLGSVEAVIPLKAGEFTGSCSHYDWYIQPQSQITWMNVRASEHTEKNGTKVQLSGDGNIQSRLGVRTYLKGKSASDDGQAHQPRAICWELDP